jgi:excisionase family DNA binding protein
MASSVIAIDRKYLDFFQVGSIIRSTMPMQIETDDYLPTADVAAALGLGTDTVKIYCQKGILRAIKLGSQWLIEKSEIKRYKRDRKTVGRPKKIV